MNRREEILNLLITIEVYNENKYFSSQEKEKKIQELVTRIKELF